MQECNNQCGNEAVELKAGEFVTDLFCSWVCLGEFVEEVS